LDASAIADGRSSLMFKTVSKRWLVVAVTLGCACGCQLWDKLYYWLWLGTKWI